MTCTDSKISTAMPVFIERISGDKMESLTQMLSGLHYQLIFEQNNEYQMNMEEEEEGK